MSYVVTLPKPGEILGSNYRVDCALENDGVTAVFGATAQVSGVRCTLRCFLSDDAPAWAAATEHFIRHARRADLFQDRRIVEVYAVQKDRGAFFSVSEWLEGLTLERHIQERGPIPVEYALELLTPCVQALARAHRTGIVHGDVHPSNVFVCSAARSEAERARLQNFGYGALSARSELSKLREERRGEPRCTVPEDPRDEALWVRADIHAFGIMLYRVLAAASVDKRDAGRQLRAVIAQRAPHIPAAVAEIIARSTAVEPGERFATLDEMAESLAEQMRPRAMGSTPRRANSQATIREMPAVTMDIIQRASTRAGVAPAPGVRQRVDTSRSMIVERDDGGEQDCDAILLSPTSASVARDVMAQPPLLAQRVGDDVQSYTWIKPASEIAEIDWLSTSVGLDDQSSYGERTKSQHSFPRWAGHLCVCVALLGSIVVAIELVAQARSPMPAARSSSLSHRRQASTQAGQAHPFRAPATPRAIPSTAAKAPLSAAAWDVAPPQMPTAEPHKPRPAQDGPRRISPTALPVATTRDVSKPAAPASASKGSPGGAVVRGESSGLDEMHLW